MAPIYDPLIELPENLTVPRTDAVYNCHAYLTKVPIGAILPFIGAFTKRGDTVLDFFAGSGMTGLAAVRAGRRAEMSDISALGQHIAQGYLTRTPHTALREAAQGVMAYARDARWEQSEKSFRRAIELDPGGSDSRYHFAMYFLMTLGRIQEALQQFRT